MSRPAAPGRHVRGVARCHDTDRGKRASFDRQASATDSASFPGLFPPKANKTVFLFVSFHQRSDAVRNLVPRFDRARNLTPGLPPSPLTV